MAIINGKYYTARAAVKIDGIQFYELKESSENAAFFHDLLEKIQQSNPKGEAVELKDVSQYENLRNFVSADGKSVFSIAPNGDVESLASMPHLKRGVTIAKAAIVEGGDRLDCYSIPIPGHSKGGLNDIYNAAGFKEVATVDINPDYDDTNGAAQHVSVMGVTDKPIDKVRHFDKDSYEEAQKYRDSVIDRPPFVAETKEQAKANYELAIKHGLPTIDDGVKKVSYDLVNYYKPMLTEIKSNVQQALKNYDNLSFAQKLQTEQDLISVNKTNKLIADNYNIINADMLKVEDSIKSKILQAGSDAYRGVFYQMEMSHDVKADIDYRLVDKNVIKALVDKPVAGKTLSQRLYNNRNQLADDVNSAISRAYLQGQSRNDAVADIQNAIFKSVDGEVQGSYDKAMRIARTEMSRVTNAANLQSYQDAADMGIDIKKMWSWGAGDKGGTRESHEEADGQTVGQDEQFEVDGLDTDGPGQFGDPAEDCNCNCTTIPVIDDISPSLGGWGDDAGENYQDYDDWKASLDDGDSSDGIDNDEEKEDNEDSSGVTADDGTELNITNHLQDQMKARGVSVEDVQDAINNPLKVGNVVYDEQNRPSQAYIGNKATAYVNPTNNNITTVHPTHSKLANKLGGSR